MLRPVVLLVLGMVSFLAVRYFSERYPEHLPWTPLRLTQPIGYLTSFKFAQMRMDLQNVVAFSPKQEALTGLLPPVRASTLCSHTDVIRRTDEGDIRYSPTVTASCDCGGASRMGKSCSLPRDDVSVSLSPG